MITLMVPTMNRSGFVERLLSYYANTGYKHWISIGDSSDSEHLQRTKETAEKFKGKLKIIHREYPKLSDAQCIRKIIDSVSTPFAVFLPDDDFIIPGSLDKCAWFLEQNPGYSAAHGSGISLYTSTNGPYGNLASAVEYFLTIVDEMTASQRLRQFFCKPTVPLFSVMKIDTWKKIYSKPGLTDRAFDCELLPSCLSVVEGKIAQIDCLYLVRYLHNQRYLLSKFPDWIAGQEWRASYNLFIKFISEELSRADNFDIAKAEDTVKRLFWIYVVNKMSAGLELNIKKKIDFGKKIKSLKNRVFPSRNPGLKLFLTNRYRFHKDFMGVYNAIVQGKKIIQP